MNDAETAFHMSFGREPHPALAGGFVEKSCCSLQSLLPDGFARRITESELPINCIPLVPHSENPCQLNRSMQHHLID
jgi:hypothetical protein